jgi:hypothetical protein
MKATANYLFLLVLLIGSTATAQQRCSSGPPAKALIDWPEFGSGPCRTGFNPYEFVLSPATVGNLQSRCNAIRTLLQFSILIPYQIRIEWREIGSDKVHESTCKY